MKQFVIGAGSALLLAAGGVVWWTGSARTEQPIAAVPAGHPVTPYAAEELPEPPAASEKTREEKRFSRYDKDRNGAVAREEFLAARRKAYAKLDTNGDGRLSFEEYAVKTNDRFAKADGDRSGTLTPAEFVATRIARKTKTGAKARCECTPTAAARDDDG